MSKNEKQRWLKQKYNTQTERLKRYTTISDYEVPPLVVADDIDITERSLGFPGEYPFTRGVQASMYRGRLWTMRQFAGFGSATDTNQRFHFLLSQGQTGLSTAFDMPTLMGYDPDHQLSRGEVGREGVSVCCIDDMEVLFSGIDLANVTTSMTINCSAAPIIAMYFAVAKRRGIDLNQIGGTIQNDILKEYVAQKEWICPPASGVRLTCDIIEYCTFNARKFNPISISGYHIREAGATAIQELAFTIYNAVTYVEECLRRGMKIDSFAPRLSFFFDVHNDFFEEIAKFRAARRLWAKIVKERFFAKDENSCKLRTHAQTAGVSLTAQQPLNNIARVAIQALAAVLGGTQSLHTNSMDETLALPSEEAAKVALRTQQIIAEETGVTNVIDPLGGSYYVEFLTDKIEEGARNYIDKLDKMGGMLKAIENGFPQKEIADSAYKFQLGVEQGERVIIGVNKYADKNEKITIPIHEISESLEADTIKKLNDFKNKRNDKIATELIYKLKTTCGEGKNVMPILIEAVENGVTLGECCQVFREIFGEYRDPGFC